MIDPYTVLDVPLDADNESIKQAYLVQIRHYPADHYPERFQMIRSAFEKIQNKRQRLAYQLFETEMPTAEGLLTHLQISAKPGRPSLQQFQKLLQMGQHGVKS